MATNYKKFRSRFGTKFFEVDVFDDTGKVITKVGEAKMRVIRHQANYTKVVAKRSMKRQRRYRSASEMPPRMQMLFKRARQLWHIRGETGPEPLATLVQKPAPVGKPPGVGKNAQLKRFLFAQPNQTGRQARGGSYLVGPQLLPNASKSRGPNTVPEVHEHTGVRVNPASAIAGRARTAYYPQRPYMMPALRISAPKFPQMWKDKVK